MRVISGTARGVRLKRVPGDTTRPIMDRVKENLFNLIPDDYIRDQRWLDVFAGTGSVGIEALSRGASHTVFLDNARQAIRTIQNNLTVAKVTDRATVRHTDAFAYLATTTESFDVIYVAPPQYRGVWVGAMTGIELRLDQLLVPDGIVIVQIDPKEYMELDLQQLTLYKQKTYGSTMLCFYERGQ